MTAVSCPRVVYWAEATGEGPVSGRTVSVRLGTHLASTRRLALRWLHHQAHRIADGLDPAPDASWLAGTARALPPVSADVPSALRQWCADDDAQSAAMAQLGIAPFSLAVSDHTGLYTLSVWPVTIPADAAGLSRAGRIRL